MASPIGHTPKDENETTFTKIVITLPVFCVTAGAWLVGDLVEIITIDAGNSLTLYYISNIDKADQRV